jgi:hypothetical protein
MNELLFGIVGIILLYILGNLLYPDLPHRPIQQELIKWEEE